MLARTAPLREELARALPDRPFGIRFWDGSVVPPTNGTGPTIDVRSPAAVAHELRAPGQLGLGRAYVTGELDVDDLDEIVDLLDSWQAPDLDREARVRLMLAAARACGLRLPPRPPAAELRPRGARHSRERDSRAVRHHYDLSPDFFALFLDESMTYSCGVFSRGAATLEEAQEAKLELVCRKLALEPGQRVLDVGSGWGSFAIHAASRHGVRVLGVTLSPPQVEWARRRAAELGVADRVEFRVADYRELDEAPFDAVSSIGMAEHVGACRIDLYAKQLARLVRPGGRVLNHAIARLHHGGDAIGAFTHRYVFPDGELLHLSRTQLALERAGLVTDHVEGFAADYAETLRHWAQRFDERLDEAIRLAGDERVRVWRLYLRASRARFARGHISIYQTLCHRPPAPGPAQAGLDGTASAGERPHAYVG